MFIGIVGLGLIGGSFAKAYRRDRSSEIYAYDIDATISQFGRASCRERVLSLV